MEGGLVGPRLGRLLKCCVGLKQDKCCLSMIQEQSHTRCTRVQTGNRCSYKEPTSLRCILVIPSVLILACRPRWPFRLPLKLKDQTLWRLLSWPAALIFQHVRGWPGHDVQLNRVPRWLRSPGPQVLKNRDGAMPDTRWRLGDRAVNISGKVCLQGTSVGMGRGSV